MAIPASPPPSEVTRSADYQRELQRYQQVAFECDRRGQVLTTLSRGSLGIAVAFVLTAWQYSEARLICIPLAIIFGICFGALLSRVGYLRVDSDRAKLFTDINAQGVARILRRWESISDVHVEKDPKTQQTAVDLDLFGHNSLMKLICTARTSVGIATLTAWFTEPNAESEIADRRRIASELAPSLKWRQQHEALCRGLRRHWHSVTRLRDWAADDAAKRKSFLAYVYARSLLVAMPLSLLASVIVPSGATFLPVLVMVACNVLLTTLFSGKIHTSLKELTGGPDMQGLNSLCGVFSHTVNAPLGAQIPAQLQAKNTEIALFQLKRILSLALLMQRPTMILLVYMPLQLLFLWDHHIIRLMTMWKECFGRQTADWFETVAYFEAVNSLASLEYEHPDWCTPNFVSGDRASDVCVKANAIGHPLLPLEECIRNDVKIGPSHTLFLLTGSNMSGKSTLLRAIGLNVILAHAGATCCCTNLRLPLLHVMTSIRISDSLSRGVSFFLSEVLRLREIVSAINDKSSSRPTLFLIDEILNGTNSRERLLAVERFIDFLLASSAIGIITTHDLDLADRAANRASLRLFHLRDLISDMDAEPKMEFDYVLRSGLTPVTNAIKIIELFGLPGGAEDLA